MKNYLSCFVFINKIIFSLTTDQDFDIPLEFLNLSNPNRFPAFKLDLKIDAIIMILMRNLNASKLSNVTKIANTNYAIKHYRI